MLYFPLLCNIFLLLIYFLHSNLYLLTPYSYIAPFHLLLIIAGLFFISMILHFFFVIYICLFYFLGFQYKGSIQYKPFSVWLISLGIITTRPTRPIVENDIISFFLWLTLHGVYIPYFLCPLICWCKLR